MVAIQQFKMKRKAVVILTDSVFNNITEHSQINPDIECGGFLFGKISEITDGVIHCYVNGIYRCEGAVASKTSFVFTWDFFVKAKEWGNNNNMKMIGFYHSHIYQPNPTEQDLKIYKSIFRNKEWLSIIYSPTYGMHADFICRDSIIIGNDIYKQYDDDSYKIADNIFNNENKKHPR